MSAIVDISTAVAALLTTGKAAGWFDGFPAIGVIERQWLPNWEPADVQTLRIGVAPRGQDRERLARMVDTVEPVVLIGIMAHIPATADIDNPTTVDPYANLAVRIAEIIASGILPAPAVDAKLISVAHVIVDPEMMAKRVFYSLITTTWRVAEAVRIGLPPAPTVAPVLTGTPTVGLTLTCSTGTWLYAPTSYAYSWHVDGVANPELGSASTLVLTGGMVGSAITCVVTATNAAGSAVSAVSNALTVAAAALSPMGDAQALAYDDGVPNMAPITVDGGQLGYIDASPEGPEGSLTTIPFVLTAPPYNSYSIAIWLRKKWPPGSATEFLTTGGVIPDIMAGMSGSNVSLIMGSASAATVVGDDNWHLLVGIRDQDSGNVTLYKDGVLVDTVAAGGAAPLADSGNVVVGYADPSAAVVGTAALWTRALSPAEAASLYADTVFPP
jgi:hypothetical protein